MIRSLKARLKGAYVRWKWGLLAEDLIRPIVSRIDSPVVFELGAHVGSDTERITGWLRRPYTYYAWEPDPRNLERLREVVRRSDGVRLVEAAVGEQDGRAPFFLSSGGGPAQEHTASSSLHKPTARLKEEIPWLKFDDSVEVTVRSLDSFCDEQKVTHIDFLWADIQGAEKQLVHGGSRILKHTKYLFLEQSPTGIYEGQWLWEEMWETMREDWEVIHRFPNDVLLYNRHRVRPADLPRKWACVARALSGTGPA